MNKATSVVRWCLVDWGECERHSSLGRGRGSVNSQGVSYDINPFSNRDYENSLRLNQRPVNNRSPWAWQTSSMAFPGSGGGMEGDSFTIVTLATMIHQSVTHTAVKRGTCRVQMSGVLQDRTLCHTESG